MNRRSFMQALGAIGIGGRKIGVTLHCKAVGVNKGGNCISPLVQERIEKTRALREEDNDGDAALLLGRAIMKEKIEKLVSDEETGNEQT